MKKVFLYAYDHINLGDDLFIETIANRYPKVQFYLESDSSNEIVFSHVKNLQILDKDSKKLKALEKIRPSFAARYCESRKKKCDAVVYIGGSIFMEYPTWKNIVTWWDYQSKNHPFYVLGANFGPYHTEAYRKGMEDNFKNLKDICFRDKNSFGLFPKVPTVRYAPDILFSYPMPKVVRQKNKIFFSVVPYDKFDSSNKRKDFTEKAYKDMLKNVINHYVADGYYVQIASFCKKEGDLELAEELSRDFSNGVEVLSYEGINREEFIKETASSEYIIAMRFHGIILGMAAGIPVFPIVYSNKTINILKDMEFQGCYGDLRNPETLQYENTKKNLDEKYLIDVKMQIEQSKEHFEKLDQLLLP